MLKNLKLNMLLLAILKDTNHERSVFDFGAKS